jgi:alpha-L-fucosidase
MKVNAESIHGTTASLFAKASWDGRSTTRHHKDGSTTIYLHVFNPPDGGKLVVNSLKTRPDKAVILGRTGTLEITGSEAAWTISYPAAEQDPVATVVALTFRGKPEFE